MTLTAPAPQIAASPADLSGSLLSGSFARALNGLRAVPTTVADYRSIDDEALVALSASASEQVTLAQTHLALIAGEVARRSAPELGSQGLAQRTGHRTPEQFIKNTTGASGRDAVTAVRAGRLLTETADAGVVDQVTGEIAAPVTPWLAPVAEALAAGILSVGAADAIGWGLKEPNSAVSIDQLRDAAIGLVGQAVAGLNVDALCKEARLARAELDVAGIKVAEAERYAARNLELSENPVTGGGRLTWDLDPETFVLVKQVYDRATSPKLGTVRFVDQTQKAKADAIAADVRTAGQLASDAFLQLLVLGTDANPNFLIGSGAPVIRVTTTRKAGAAFARIEGASDPVSTDTLDRLGCEGQLVLIGFDEKGIPIDLGREQRLFNKNQREILAVKWGKCAHPGCDRPPSWCEAHHIVQWKRDQGKTDVADGILLCKHHHLLYHNEGWEISRDGNGDYWLAPPINVDPNQTPILLQQSRNMHDLAREQLTRATA